MRYFIVLLVAVFLVGGCAGHRSADLEETERGIRHKDTNASILQPSVSPGEMARAKESLSQAKINEAMADSIREGRGGEVAGSHLVVIVNQDPTEKFYFHHPSRNAQLSINPGGDYKAVNVTEIPQYIHGRFSGEREPDRYRIYKKSKVYNGLKTDAGARVQSD